MAITKQKKQEIVAQYGEWLEKSQGAVLAEYIGMTMKDLDDLRAKVREAGGEFHIVKNTLTKIALSNADMEFQDETLTGTTAIGFAFEDAPALAKAMATPQPVASVRIRNAPVCAASLRRTPTRRTAGMSGTGDAA